MILINQINDSELTIFKKKASNERNEMNIKAKIKDFIVTEFLIGSQAEELPDDLNLLKNGIIDSLAVLKLVAYMENEFDITLEPEEIDTDNLNSVMALTSIIEKKLSQIAGSEMEVCTL